MTLITQNMMISIIFSMKISHKQTNVNARMMTLVTIIMRLLAAVARFFEACFLVCHSLKLLHFIME